MQTRRRMKIKLSGLLGMCDDSKCSPNTPLTFSQTVLNFFRVYETLSYFNTVSQAD